MLPTGGFERIKQMSKIEFSKSESKKELRISDEDKQIIVSSNTEKLSINGISLSNDDALLFSRLVNDMIKGRVKDRKDELKMIRRNVSENYGYVCKFIVDRIERGGVPMTSSEIMEYLGKEGIDAVKISDIRRYLKENFGPSTVKNINNKSKRVYLVALKK